MLVRLSVLFAAVGLVLATTGCSSLTRPDPIQIAAEPTPAPTLRELPAGPAGPAGRAGNAPAAPGGAQAAPHPGGGG